MLPSFQRGVFNQWNFQISLLLFLNNMKTISYSKRPCYRTYKLAKLEATAQFLFPNHNHGLFNC